MDWYDRADDYDLLYAADAAVEARFLVAASERWGVGAPRRTLEPFCGPGRAWRHLPGRTFGFDRNRHMLRAARARGPCFRADAGRFAVRAASFDLAFALIDSFRHLPTEDAARAHLRAVAHALRPGAVYVVGLELTGGDDAFVDAWEAAGPGVRVAARVGSAGTEGRRESVRVRLDVVRGASRERVDAVHVMRTYTARQFEDLLDGEGSFEPVACFRGGYDGAGDLELSELAGSAVVVLRRE